MSSETLQLDRFRPYLLLLARLSWDQRLQAKLDPSDIVQETFLRAHNSLDQFRGTTDEELAAWLCKILSNVLLERQRHFHRDKRDIAQERPLEAFLAESSRRLAGLAGEDPSPSRQAEFSERALRIAVAMENLPETQRDALVLHYWHGQSIPEISQHMDCTPAAVAGLVHRGLKQLRSHLSDLK